MQVNSTQAVGGFFPDIPVACMLSKVLDWVFLAVSWCVTSGAAPAVVECASPGVIADVIPVNDTSTSCGSAPPVGDDSPISGDDNASSS